MSPQTAVAQSSGFEFKILIDGNTYEVYIRPLATPAAPNLTLTSQITLKVPHAVGADKFEVSNLQSHVVGTAWALTSRIDAPLEDPNTDYLSFSVSFPSGDYGSFQWAAGVEQKVFSIQNSGRCLGPVALLENSDPFNQLPNSARTNPGNQIDVLGVALDNAYIRNYDVGQAVCSPTDGDDDGDGISNAEEGTADVDGDGVPNYADNDSDNDGIPDRIEYELSPADDHDSDNDGIPDFLDLDSDNDGINDAQEAGHSADALRDGLADGPYGLNGLSDLVETAPESGAINYPLADSDKDAVPDYLDLDSDNDTIADLIEGGSGALDADNDGVADGPDSDGDGIADSADGNDDGDRNDFGNAPSAGLPNADNDPIPDYRDGDSNGDGIDDIKDAGNGALDADNDGMVDDTTDSDGDGIPDNADTDDAIFGGLPNPLTDGDGDGIPDKREGNGDPDGDGIPNDQDL
ncbi:MAG: hypothetical protein KDE58_18250, partial [Caldilineaceae bacterium]|nr:hypothetical protein [Caldilineaceae bacterium]